MGEVLLFNIIRYISRTGNAAEMASDMDPAGGIAVVGFAVALLVLGVAVNIFTDRMNRK